MGIVVKRCDKSTKVIIWTFERDFTLDEYRAALADSRRLGAEIATAYDLIVDVSACARLAPNTFFELGDTSATLAQNLRSVAVVGANVMVRTILSAFRESNAHLGNKMFFADTMQQARQLLCPTLKRATGVFSTQEFRPISF